MKIYQDELGWRIGTGGDERVAQVFKTRKDAQKYQFSKIGRAHV